MNKYKNPNSNIVGSTGQMYNEATKTEKQINYNHYGIFANDNTYDVTFNPYINRPPTKKMAHYPIKPPPTNQHITKTYNEPPVSLTDGKTYLNNAASNAPLILPPFLNKPETHTHETFHFAWASPALIPCLELQAAPNV